MNLRHLLASMLMLGIAMTAMRETRAAGTQSGRIIPAVGPRAGVGSDAPLTSVEMRQFAKRVVVEGRTAAAVQTACERATREKIPVVFLPAGEYLFETEVRVPADLILLGEGSKTLCRTKNTDTHLFHVDGDHVRFTRLKLQGADATSSESNDTFGISVFAKKNIRIDHCELTGFSYATNFGDEATAQIDHCSIHHNLRDGLGYGVAVYSGAYILISDNEFSQNRHSLASNGALDWSSGERLGKFLHKQGVRKTHWEFLHNRVGSNDLSTYELMAVDTHPGMDGSFVVEGNIFENLRYGVGIRDGSGLIRANLFRNLRTLTTFRPVVGISISYGTHNNIPVENAMPHDIHVEENTFLGRFEEEVMSSSKAYKLPIKYQLGQAENIVIQGKLIPETRKEGPGAPRLLRLQEMSEEGVLRWREENLSPGRRDSVAGKVTDERGHPVAQATVLAGDRSTATDANGRFSFTDVSEAAQFLVVEKAGFETALSGMPVVAGRSPVVNIRLLPDRSPPHFVNLCITDLAHNHAAIAWETSKPTTGEVELKEESAETSARQFGTSVGDPTTSHNIALTDLHPATTYRGRIKVKDAAGNVATSDEVVFNTAPLADPSPPTDWSYYAGAGNALWGRTQQEAHSGKFSAFLKAVAHDGGLLNVALVVGDSNGYSGAKAYPAEPGATYQYSFWTKGDFKNVGLLLMTWKSDTGDSATRQHATLLNFPPGEKWTLHQGEFKMPADAKRFALMFQVYAANLHRDKLGVVYVDDVELRTGKTPVVKNGGAENE